MIINREVFRFILLIFSAGFMNLVYAAFSLSDFLCNQFSLPPSLLPIDLAQHLEFVCPRSVNFNRLLGQMRASACREMKVYFEMFCISH